jgi:hypothetical protein
MMAANPNSAIKRQIGKLERRVKRTNVTQTRRREQITKLRAKLKS